MFDQRETLVVWNPSAGSAEQNAEIEARLKHSGNVRLLKTRSREHCIEQVCQECENGTPAVIAGGGDGTVNAVLEGIMLSAQNPVLGILPLGTGNDFARSLGLDMNPARALTQLSEGESRNVDVMRYVSSGRKGWYLNMLTGGNTGVYMDHLTDEVKRLWGPFCYLRGVIDLIQHLRVFEIEVTADDGLPQSFEALNLFLANGRMSGGGMRVCPEAKFDDGQIDVIIIGDGPPGEIASLSTDYVVADYLNHDLVTHLRAKSVAIESHPPLPLTADGDRIGETTLKVNVLPQALSMLVPAETPPD